MALCHLSVTLWPHTRTIKYMIKLFKHTNIWFLLFKFNSLPTIIVANNVRMRQTRQTFYFSVHLSQNSENKKQSSVTDATKIWILGNINQCDYPPLLLQPKTWLFWLQITANYMFKRKPLRKWQARMPKTKQHHWVSNFFLLNKNLVLAAI